MKTKAEREAYWKGIVRALEKKRELELLESTRPAFHDYLPTIQDWKRALTPQERDELHKIVHEQFKRLREDEKVRDCVARLENDENE